MRAPSIEREISWGKILVGLMFLAAAGAFLYFDMQRPLSLGALKANRQELLAYTDSHYGTAVAVFTVLYLLQITLSLPGGALLTLAGGFLFGSVIASRLLGSRAAGASCPGAGIL